MVILGFELAGRIVAGFANFCFVDGTCQIDVISPEGDTAWVVQPKIVMKKVTE